MLAFTKKDFLDIVEDINDYHKVFSDFFLSKDRGVGVNYKTTRVSDVVFRDDMIIDKDFLQTIDNYHTDMNIHSTKIDLEYVYNDYDARTRVKQKDSIINKLFHYRETNLEEGKVAINKCLDNIYGIRITFKDLDHNLPEFIQAQDVAKNNFGVKIYCREKNGYKGTHIYFRNKSNFNFPWELQVWSSKDAKRNEELHRAHESKRKYTSWPDVYLNSTNLERSDI